MSRLIKINPDTHSDPKPEGHEFGSFVISTLPNFSAIPKEEVLASMVNNASLTLSTNIDLAVSKVEVQKLQDKYDFCKHNNMLNKIHF